MESYTATNLNWAGHVQERLKGAIKLLQQEAVVDHATLHSILRAIDRFSETLTFLTSDY